MTEPATAAWKCPRCGITYKGGSECPKCLTPKPATAAHRWVEFALRYADGRISPQPNIGLAEAQDFAKRHDLTVVSRVVTATEWEDADV